MPSALEGTRTLTLRRRVTKPAAPEQDTCVSLGHLISRYCLERCTMGSLLMGLPQVMLKIGEEVDAPRV